MRKCHRWKPSTGEETSLPYVKICLSLCCPESPLCSYHCPCNLFPSMLPFYIETRSKLIPNPSFPYTCNTSFPKDVVYQGFPLKLVSSTQQKACNPFYIQPGINALACWKAATVHFAFLGEKTSIHLSLQNTFFFKKMRSSQYAYCRCYRYVWRVWLWVFLLFVCFLQMLSSLRKPTKLFRKLLSHIIL